MRQLLQSNDAVLLSFVEALLRDSDIEPVILDRNMSIMEGSIGVLPRRLVVAEEDFAAAQRILREADLGDWLKSDDPA